MSDLYAADILEWSEQQAALLRRAAAGERLNETSPDWVNIIEKILKAEAWPLSPTVPHWQAEARVFRADARRRFVPFMRQRINPASIHRDALRGLPDQFEGQPPLPLPPVCALTLDRVVG